MTELAALEAKFDNQLGGVRSELQELTKALRDLIRLDGEIKNIATLVGRVASEVDDHEKRMRVIEQSNVVNSVKIGVGERVYWILGMVAINILTAIIVFEVTR